MTTLFTRHYSRSLYFGQFLYAFFLVFTQPTKSNFSRYLDDTWLDWIPKISDDLCNNNDSVFLCSNVHLYWPAIIWAAATAGFFVLIKIISCCCKKEARFLSFYNFWKGFFYWFYGPLVYLCTVQIKSSLDSEDTSSKDFQVALITVIVFLGITFVELIGYKCAQRDW